MKVAQTDTTRMVETILRTSAKRESLGEWRVLSYADDARKRLGFHVPANERASYRKKALQLVLFEYRLCYFPTELVKRGPRFTIPRVPTHATCGATPMASTTPGITLRGLIRTLDDAMPLCPECCEKFLTILDDGGRHYVK